MSGTVHIAYCPEHGLHGERQECFVCGGPVVQIPMAPVDVASVAVAAELERGRAVEEAARQLALCLQRARFAADWATVDEAVDRLEAVAGWGSVEYGAALSEPTAKPTTERTS